MSKRNGLGKFLSAKRDKIGKRFSRVFFVQTIYRLKARIGDFFYRIGFFEFGNQLAVLFDCGKLIHAAQRRHGFAGDKLGSYSVHVYFGFLSVKRGNYVFVDVVACKDESVLVSGVVQHFSRLFGQIGKVAAVKTNAKRFVSFLFQSVEHFYRIGNTSSQRVVSVHQQQTTVGIHIGKSVECGKFVRK